MRALELALLGCCACGALACGTAPQSDSASVTDAGVSVVVAPAYEASPVFVRALIIPQEIEPGGSAAIAVEAHDPYGLDSGISYRWSAASGSFSRPNAPITAYQCDAAGAQILNVIAENPHGDLSQLALAVNCVAQ